MAVPDNPPVVPSFAPCGWSGPLNACDGYFGLTWDSPTCPPTVGGVVVSGYEDFTELCGISRSFPACWNPSFAANLAWQEAGGPAPDLACVGSVLLPTCSKNWGSGHCHLNLIGEEDGWEFEGECPACPEHYVLNPGDCLCYLGTPCPDGTCYCETSGTCVSCSNPVGDCEGLSDCFWNPTTCAWDCVGAECPPGEVYDYETCACVSRCSDGFCWCELLSDCIECEVPDNPPEHDCVWNTATCVWDCETCPDGYCWCKATSSCQDCSHKPDCFTQLHCKWSQEECTYLCDDTATKCGGRTWLGYPDCRCQGGGGCDLAQMPLGWLARAYNDGGNVWVGTSHDAGVTWDDVLAASDADPLSAPSLAVDRWDTLFLAYHRGSGLSTTAVLCRSDDLGRTWTETFSLLGRSYPRPCVTPERLLLVSVLSSLGFLSIEASEDGGVTFGSGITDVIGDAQEARPDLRQDRRGFLHLVYEATDGSVLHRYSEDGGDTWTDPATLAAGGTGAEIGYQIGVERALLTYWADGELLVATTDETGAVYLEEVAGPTVAEYEAQQLGVLWDRREHAYLLGMVDSLPEVVWSGNVYREWAEPT